MINLNLALPIIHLDSGVYILIKGSAFPPGKFIFKILRSPLWP